MTEVTVCTDAEAVAAHAARVLARRLGGGGERHVALAGGTTPRRAYELLATLAVDWAGVHLWLGDERCVPPGADEANARMVDESLLSRLAGTASPPRLHAARGDVGPEDAAWLYGRELVAALGEVPVLDVAVLGLGEDGHTASLFPGHPEAGAREAPVVGVRSAPKPPAERLTMTLPVLARARYTVLVATGAGKRDALQRVRARDETVPAGRLGTALDEIVCDGAAAGRAAGGAASA